MRTRTRILAFFLTLLMLVGMLPLSIFAADGTGSLTFDEQLQTYIAENGGELLFASGFNTDGDSNSELETSGNNSLSLVPKKSTIEVKDGFLNVKSSDVIGPSGDTNDPYVNSSFNIAAGETMVVEMELRVDELPVDGTTVIPLIQFIDRNVWKNASGAGQSLFSDVLSVRGDKALLDSAKNVIGTFEIGDVFKISVVMVPRLNAAYYYMDGVFAGASYLAQNYKNTYNRIEGESGVGSSSVRNTPRLNELRFLQIPNKGKGEYSLDSIYVYKNVTVPYGVEAPAPGSETYTEFAEFLQENNAVLFGGTDFEYAGATIGFKNVNGKTVSTTVGETDTIYDPWYDLVNGVFTTTTSGAGWTYTDYTGLSWNLVVKLTTAQFIKEDGNTFYRLNTGWPRSLDSLADVNFGLYYIPGEDIVVSADVRADADRSTSYNLFGLVHRAPYGGADQAGNSRVHQYLLRLNNKNELYAETGNVYIGRILADEFTNIACIVHPQTNTFDVYLNGVCVAEDLTFLNETNLKIYKEGYTVNGTTYPGAGDEWYNYFKPGSMRAINNNSMNVLDAGIEIDNIFCYNADKVYGETEFTDSGWQQTEEGYWRYYDEKGIPAVGNVEIDDITYYFDQNGYYSKAERYSYFDLTTYFTSKGTSTANISDASAALRLGANTDIVGSYKYSALWTDFFKAGLPGSSANVDTGATQVNMPVSLKGINESLLKTNFIFPLKSSTRASTVIDISEFDALEINWYTNKPSDFAMVMMINSLDGAKDAYGYVDAKPYNDGNNFIGGATYWSYYLKLTEASGIKGWNSTVLDLTNGANPVKGSVSLAGNRYPRMETVTGLSFSTTWSNVNNDNYVAEGFEFYFDSINFIKYVPVTTDPRGLDTVMTEGSNVYVYNDTMSDYSKGWQTVNGDTYYCNVYNGHAVTGAQIIDGVSYVFDDNGVCIEENASGVFSVGGCKYVYVDGVLQTGEFEYDGVKYFAGSDGIVYSEIGKIDYTYDAEYVAPDYSKLTSYLVLEDFTGRSGSIGFTQKGAENRLSGGDNYKNGSYIAFITRLTKFHYVDDGNGNIVLKVYNKAGFVDSYSDVNLNTEISSNNTEVKYLDDSGSYVKSDIVIEITAKLGEDWHTYGTLLQAIDRVNGKTDANLFLINDQGYVYNNAGIICKLSTEGYTRLSAVYDVDAKIFHLYVNGVEITTFKPSSNYIAPTQFRVMQYNSDDVGHGTMYLDNYALYLASEPVDVVTGVTLRDGLVQEGEYYRYYKNGVIQTGTQTVDGTVMMFDTKTGLNVFTGFNNDYYYKNGERCDYVGLVNIDGLEYFFKADYKVLKNNTVTVGMKVYTADGNGVLGNVQYVTDSMELLGAFEIANSTSNGELEIDADDSFLVYNFKGLTHGPTTYFDTPVDITGMDAIRLRMYLGGDKAIDADLGIILGQDAFYFPVEATLNAAGNNITVTAALEGRYSSMGEVPNRGTTKDTGWYTSFGGITYRVFSNTYKDGDSDVTEYYLRDWSYDMFTMDLANYGTGWVTIDLPLSKFGHTGSLNREAVEYIQFAVSGWSLNGNGQLAPDAANLDIRIASISAVSFSNRDTSKNGIVGDYFFESGAVTSGWQTINGINYYFDTVTGKMAKGLVYIKNGDSVLAVGNSAGKYYEFRNTGAYVGEANGLFELQYPVKNDNVYVYKTITRAFVDGVAGSGLTTLADGNLYYCDTVTGDIVRNTIMVIDDKTYTFDENGVGTIDSGWYEDEYGNRYYYDEEIGDARGLVEINNKYYYFHSESGVLIRNSWVVYHNMYFGADGAAASGIVEGVPFNGEKETMYFVDGVACAAEIIDEENKLLYIFGEDGVLDEIVDLSKSLVTLTLMKDGQVLGVIRKSGESGDIFTYTLTSYPCYVIYDADGNEIKDLDYSVVMSEEQINIVLYYKSYDEAGKEHNLDEGKVLVQPGCGTDGKMIYTCKDCGKTFEEAIPMLNEHEFGETITVIPPGCSTTGLGYRECKLCGYAESTVVIPATGNHNFSTELYYDPNEEIYYDHHYYICLDCGRKLDPEHHTYTDWVVSEDTGVHERHCTVCGYTEQVNGHIKAVKYDSVNHWFECTACGDISGVTAHKLSERSDADSHFNGCACGYRTDVEKHTLVKIQDKVEASCTSEGSTEGRKCADCGYIAEKVATIGKVSHTYSDDVYSYDDDYHWHVCSECGTKVGCDEHTVVDNKCTICGWVKEN